mmetsp:Transcript_25493/g.51470  ORF Transcript_25493/g.51470 Transcript_25493/m.51470 type:complete len:205 (+) Transcript_25493:633-1247(+)
MRSNTHAVEEAAVGALAWQLHGPSLFVDLRAKLLGHAHGSAHHEQLHPPTARAVHPMCVSPPNRVRGTLGQVHPRAVEAASAQLRVQSILVAQDLQWGLRASAVEEVVLVRIAIVEDPQLFIAISHVAPPEPAMLHTLDSYRTGVRHATANRGGDEGVLDGALWNKRCVEACEPLPVTFLRRAIVARHRSPFSRARKVHGRSSQ